MKTRPASPHETEVIRSCRSWARRAAASLGGLECMDQCVEDAEQAFLLTLVDACRTWAERSPERPPDKWLSRAISGKRMKYFRDIRVARGRRAHAVALDTGAGIEDDGMSFVTVVAGDNVEDDIMVDDQQFAFRAVVETMKATMPSRDFTLMMLRYAEDLKPTEMDVDGLDAAQISRLIYRARARAEEFLAGLGIGGLEDAERWVASREDQQL